MVQLLSLGYTSVSIIHRTQEMIQLCSTQLCYTLQYNLLNLCVRKADNLEQIKKKRLTTGKAAW